jgi:glyoxylase-like metal-dependent hydrolase (beta-lactamase superfamily II)
MSATDSPLRAGEVAPSELERELRSGASVAVLDVRDPAEFAAWHLETGDVPLVNATPTALLADPETVLRDVGDRALRVICARGNASRRAVDLLAARGVQAANVTGGMVAWSRLLVPGRVEIGTPTVVVQLRREARGCLSYVVASGGEALVVDPAPDVQAYLDEARALGAPIRHVVDTHVHADHVSGARALADAAGAELHVSEAALARGVAYRDRVDAVADGDALVLGTADVRIVALPGHTTDNVGVLVDGRALIAGDSLFADSVARPDLEVGDAGAADAAAVLHATLRERVLALGDAVVLLPCHYPGGRRGGPIAPTLGEVRAALPLLAEERDDFVADVLHAMPPRPANYLAIIDVNLGRTGGDPSGLEVGANNCAAR